MSADSQDKAPVCIGVVSGAMNGEIARSFLESAGIPTFLQPNTLGALYGLTAGDLGDVAIFVPADVAEEARHIFEELDF